MKPPKRLRQRPHWRGLPIPYVAMINPQGQPDFRVTDQQKRHSVMKNRWCQLCGQPLGRWMFFAGGTEAARCNAYFEPACHMDCVVYAMQVCPFIVGRIDHADLEKVAAAHPGMIVKADDTFAATRNERWVITKAVGYSYTRTPDGTILNVPHAILSTVALYPETMTAQDWSQIERALM